MTLSVVLWIIFGAAIGWIGSLMLRSASRDEAIATVVIGVIGAFIGGGIAYLLGSQQAIGFNAVSLAVAMSGSVLMVLAVWLLSNHHQGPLRR
jgi:uncharacterized membrane protein YeaQ/YmgE (transglycosylase-associated protein family)